MEPNQAPIGRAVRRCRQQVDEEGRIEGLDESERQASAAGQRGRARSRSVPGGMGGEEVRPTRSGPAQSVAKRRVQDGGRVGRVGLEGGPGDRMSKRMSRRAGAASTEQRGQRLLIDERRGQSGAWRAKPHRATPDPRRQRTAT